QHPLARLGYRDEVGHQPIFPTPHLARFSAALATSPSGAGVIFASLLTEAPSREPATPRITATRTGMDAPIERLDETRGELAKAWLMRVVEQSSLEEIERLPTPRIARDLPDLIGEIARAAAEDAPAAARGVEWAKRLAELTGRGGAIDAQLVRDVAGLQAVMVTALHQQLRPLDPVATLHAVERLTE